MSSEFKKAEWKINVKSLFEEILHNNENMWAMKQPLIILHSKLLKIATIANEEGYKDIVKICCKLALYEECDPYSDKYNMEKTDEFLKEKKLT